MAARVVRQPAVARIPVSNEPGTTLAYHTANADVAGMLIERVSSLSRAEFLRTRILEPLRNASLPTPRSFGLGSTCIGSLAASAVGP